MRPYYESRRIHLYLGDCRDVLPALLEQMTGAVDALITDPPYGQAVRTKIMAGDQIAGDGRRQGVRLLRGALAECAPLLAPDAHAYVFCHWESLPDFYDAIAPRLRIKNVLVWDKARGGTGDTSHDYARDYELIVYALAGRGRPLAGGRDGAVVRGFPPDRERIHPTQKPDALLAYLVGKSCPPARLDRYAVGVEIDERHCEAAARRLEALCPTA